MNTGTPPILESPPGPEAIIDGRACLYFGGTNYLGLAAHPEVIEAACEATRLYGIHSAASRSGFGNNPATLRAEKEAAAFFGTEAAFYFASGYAGNHILAQAQAGSCDAVFADEAAHFSIEEAARLCGGPVFRFRHRDPEDLCRCLARHLPEGGRPLVMSDGVFPVSGALAPVEAYLEVLARHRSPVLLLDDAHGVGVLGTEGRGTFEHFGLWSPKVNAVDGSGVALRLCATMSKAVGGFGGIIPGSCAFLERARSSSHYYDGASPPPSAAAAATAKGLELIRREPALRERLRANVARVRGGLRALGLEVEDSPAANIGFEMGSAENMRRIHEELRRRGILVPWFGSYSSAGTRGMLRVAVFATHSEEMIDRLLAELRTLL